jgi:glucoamylase
MRPASMRALLERDLAFTCAVWREPCYDLWEENYGRHYYTRLVQHAALREGALWARELGEARRAQEWREAADAILHSLDDHFDAEAGVYLTPANEDPGEPRHPFAMRLDIAVIFGVIHADRGDGPHSVLDPKILATMVALERLFSMEYPINWRRAPDCAPAMGRYANDKYFSGGAYYFSTLAAAQFYYRFAEAVGAGAAVATSSENRALLAEWLAQPLAALTAATLEERYRPLLCKALVARGDMFMAMVRTHAPESGELAEQFSQIDGAPTSAKNLAWSYAAFITALARRREAIRHLGAV